MEGMPRQLPIDQPFDLDTILDGTQDFRWRRWKDDWHSGVLRGHLIHMRQVKGGLEYRARLDLDEMLVSYFRLDEDMATIRAGLAARDAKLARLVVRRYSATYGSAQAAARHAAFSPGDGMLAGPH